MPRIAREGRRVARHRDDRAAPRWRRARAPAPRAPWRGGSNTTASNGLSSAGTNGRRNRSRTIASTGLRPCVVSAARCKRGDRRRVAVGRGDAGALGEPQREWPDAGEQVGDRLRPGAMRQHQSRQRRLRRRRSPAGRRRAAARPGRGPSAPSARRAAPPVRRGASGAPGDAARRPRASAAVRSRRQRARSAHVDVEAGFGRGHLNVERLARRRERLGDVPGGRRARRRVPARGSDSGRSPRCDARAAPQKPTSSTSCVPRRA